MRVASCCSLFIALIFLLSLSLGAADEDSLINDDDTMIVSGVNFDIPPEATEWPAGREKHYCSCPPPYNNSEPGMICPERPFYYLIKVQNWGDETAHDVMVSDNLWDTFYYIPGSTEMATQFDENGDGTDWAAIPDGPDGEFPLAGDGYKVAAMMTPCDINTLTCSDTRLIRFKVLLPHLPKSQMIYNIAVIKEEESIEKYETNKGENLSLHQGTCVPESECPEPPKSQCGGGEDTVFNDYDTILTDTDDEMVSDADTVKPKDDGCGCSVVW